MKKENNVMKICTEKQRKALVSFLCDNADMILDYLSNMDELIVKIQDSYGKVVASSGKVVKGFEERFLSLLLADEIDGKEMAKLAHELLNLAKEQQETSKSQSDLLFREYRNLFDAGNFLCVLLSKKGIDIDSLSCEKAPEVPKSKEG